MKYILIAIPGASDHPAEELGDKTPLELAKIPNMHHFAKVGKVGSVRLVPERLEPASDATFLNLLGCDADKVYTGRGPLEAANLELKLEANEIPFRMNFITESEGVLADPTAGGIATKEAKALINFLNKKVASDFVRFFAGSRHKHVAVIKDAHGIAALSAKTTAPELIQGEKTEAHLPKGPGEELLRKLMYDARLLLQDHEVNQVRVDLFENPANMIWLWGQGAKPRIEKFQDRFGFQGAVVSDTEYAKGAGRLAGLTVLDVHPAGSLQEKYEAMGKLLIQAAQEKDFACFFAEDTDLFSQAGDFKGKIGALEALDFYVLSKVREYMEGAKDVRVLITPCHALPWKVRRHVRDWVPFALAGKNIMADDVDRFSESAAKASALKISKGQELLKFFIAPESAGTKAQAAAGAR